MFEIKKLVWREFNDVPEEGTLFIGTSGSPDKTYNIYLETDGKYYPGWDTGPSFELLEDAMDAAQAQFETEIMKYLDLVV